MSDDDEESSLAFTSSSDSAPSGAKVPSVPAIPQKVKQPAEATEDVCDDSQLLFQISQRDPDALARLYDCRGPLLMSICRRIVSDEMVAEEVLEDVFWEVWSRPERYDNRRGPPIVYLILLARSRAVDRLRVMKKKKKDFKANVETSSISGAQTSSHHEADESAKAALFIVEERDHPEEGRINSTQVERVDRRDPLLNAIMHEQSQNVRLAVNGLGEIQRRVIELAFFDGLTHQQIADYLKEPLGTIKTRIRQAIVHLKEALGRSKQ